MTYWCVGWETGLPLSSEEFSLAGVWEMCPNTHNYNSNLTKEIQNYKFKCKCLSTRCTSESDASVVGFCAKRRRGGLAGRSSLKFSLTTAESLINSHKAEREISFYTDLWLYFPSTKPQGHLRMSHPEEGGVVTDGGDMVSEPGRGGLKAAMVLLQGGSTLIIRRPQVAKFIFICAARRKFFPERNIMNYETKILDLLTYKRSLSYKTSCKFQNSKLSC